MLDTRSADHNDYEVETPEYVRHGVLVMQAVLFAETELEHARILFGEIGAEPGAHYVDMGCGTGEVGRLFCRFDPAASITGVTNSAVQCALVQQRGMRSIRADFHQVPLPDDCADVVMFNESIGYGDLTGLLREAHRLLRRGGRLFIKDWYVSTTRYVADWDYV